MHARESFQHHSGDRVDLLVQNILDPTRRILSKWVLGRVGKKWTSGKTTTLEKTSRARPPHYGRPMRTNAPLRAPWEAVGSFDAPSWKHARTHESTVSWGSLRAQPPSKARTRHFIHPRQFGTFPKRLALPYSYEGVLSCYEEDVSSTRDGFSAWDKTDPETLLRRRVVDARGLYPPNRLAKQRRLSVYNWNPGPRRGKGAIEKHIAEKRHIITLQEAVEYHEHEFLTNQFNVIHYGGCAVLCNKDTLSDMKVSSTYLHDTRTGKQDRVKEGESGWVLQGFISRASFRRQPRNGQEFFSVMSLHINNNFAKKRGIGEEASP